MRACETQPQTQSNSAALYTFDSFPLTDEMNDSLLGQLHNINTKNYTRQQQHTHAGVNVLVFVCFFLS